MNRLLASSTWTVFAITTLLFPSLSSVSLGAHPEVPGTPQKQPIAIENATIHTVSGSVINGGTILFDKGRIISVAKRVPLPDNVKRIDGRGKHVYPSLFDAMTNVGLVEVNSIRASVDDRETGTINPNVRAEVAVNPDSEMIPVTRSNGVLLSLTAPTGSLITGRSAVIQLDGWTWEDMTLQTNVGLHIRWPSMAVRPNSEAKEEAEQDASPIRPLEESFQSARRYQVARRAAPQQHPRDLRWDAMLPVLARQVPLIVEANDREQIQAAVAFARRHNVRLILYGGYDAEQCAPLLKKHHIPVIIAGTYRLPQRRDDAFDAAYTLPARLRAAGIKYCLSSGGRFGASNVRNLPYHAGTAVAYGLDEQEALKSITLYPAQILGVADRVGSLEAGKQATLIVTNGNPLETETQVEVAFIQGRQVQLNDRHKRLYNKYRQKYQ